MSRDIEKGRNDTINARFLRENSFDFTPQFKLYVNTNYLPTVTDMTLFSGGRVMIIPFDRHFDEGEQDRTLKREFAKPENRSAILNWLIEGYCLLQKEGLEQRTVWRRTIRRRCVPHPSISATRTGAMTADSIARICATSTRRCAPLPR